MVKETTKKRMTVFFHEMGKCYPGSFGGHRGCSPPDRTWPVVIFPKMEPSIWAKDKRRSNRAEAKERDSNRLVDLFGSPGLVHTVVSHDMASEG